MPPPKRSKVWKFYTKEQDNIRCNECKSEVKAKAGNTSNLKRHLESNHPALFKTCQASEEVAARPKGEVQGGVKPNQQLTLEQVANRKDKMASTSIKAINVTKILTKMICVDGQPFSIVDDKGFRQLLAELIPRYEIPSRQLLSKKIIPALYEEKKELMKKRLSSENLNGISITTDTWTSRATESYLAITIHYIDSEMNIINMCWAVRPFELKHTAENISECLREVFLEFNISTETVQTYVITDNARNIRNATELLAVQSMTCFGHTIQLVINDALKKFRGLENILAKSRAITGHFKHSTNATHSLKKVQIQLDLPQNNPKQDVVTRWNSTFYMIERLVEQRKAITLVLADEDKVYNLTPHEWKVLEQLVTVLQPFEAVTKMMSGEVYPTASMIVPAIVQLKEILTSSDDLDDLREQLLQNIGIRWPNLTSNPILTTATFIDPRFKLVCFSVLERDKIIQQVLQMCTSTAQQLQQTSQPFSQSASEGVSTSLNIGLDKDSTQRCSKFWSSFTKKVNEEYSTQQKQHENSVQEEINYYLKQNPILVCKSNRALIRWTENENSFPNLVNLAKRFLCIPATSVPSERLFSKAGLVVSNKRCQLKSSRVEQLVFLNQNWDSS